MPAVSDRIIQCAPSVFAGNLNRLSYEFAHTLAGNPVFELSRLVDLAEKVATRSNPHLPGGDVYFNDGLIEPGEKPLRPDLPRTAAVDLIRKIDRAQAWIILKHVEREQGYGDVLENCIRDILQLSGPELLRKIKWFEAILFITSPNRVTEYHLDREVSWILQLQGDKEIHVFDRADKDIVPDQELEVYWTANNQAARYKPEYESRAKVYQMRPGSGVHIPINSPHWLRNGNNISVTLNINFQFHDRHWANLYRANYYLRRAGVRPHPPGAHPVSDQLKSTAFTVMQRAKQALKGRTRIPAEAREQNKRIARLVGAN
ncbi:MAG: hypothetical protein ABR905_05025 [Terracidiphilus sp.]|jgi:hypothetical protein